MPDELPPPTNPAPKTADQLLAEMFRENERLRRQLEDARLERDQFKKVLAQVVAMHAEPLTPEDIASAVPAEPFFEQLIRRLEKR